MKDSTKLIIGVAAVAGSLYLIHKFTQAPTSTGETVEKFDALGFNAYEKGGAAYVQYQPLFSDTVTTYKFNEGDYDKLNFAQKLLLSTHIIPTSWILG